MELQVDVAKVFGERESQELDEEVAVVNRRRREEVEEEGRRVEELDAEGRAGRFEELEEEEKGQRPGPVVEEISLKWAAQEEEGSTDLLNLEGRVGLEEKMRGRIVELG